MEPVARSERKAGGDANEVELHLKTLTNLDLWRLHGDNLLVVQPFMDSVIVRGEGCYLVDADGRRILDMAAGQFCSILGHSNRTFTERLQKQLESGIHLGDQYVSPNVLHAAARLASVTPGALNKVLFLSTGSEANECAMRIAKTVTGRTGMLGYSRGYYGISLATRTLSKNGENISLTTGEFALLKVLVTHPRVPLSRDKLMELARGREYEVFDRAIDVQVSRLRKLVEPDPSSPTFIQTVWGFGYVFVPDGTKA